MRWYQGLSIDKDPSDVIDVEVDFTQLLQADAIDTATITVSGVTKDSQSVSGNVVTVWISGGTAGAKGTVTIKVTTTNATPRTFERSFNVNVVDL